MTDRELMQMALDALEEAADHIGCPDDDDAIGVARKALRARLAQHEPLPAKSKGALSHEENKQHNKKILDKFYEENAHLYTAPPQREWQGLTDEEQMQVAWSCGAMSADWLDFAHEIEAKLKEKNS